MRRNRDSTLRMQGWINCGLKTTNTIPDVNWIDKAGDSEIYILQIPDVVFMLHLQRMACYSIELISINISSMEHWHHQTKKLSEGELSWGILPGGAIFVNKMLERIQACIGTTKWRNCMRDFHFVWIHWNMAPPAKIPHDSSPSHNFLVWWCHCSIELI